jgi:C4-dicarboxylate-specific signal transduction histidine kinase
MTTAEDQFDDTPSPIDLANVIELLETAKRELERDDQEAKVSLATALARLKQMRSDFAYINRVSMMGELVASLSHEIAQPITSARIYARAAQNFLDMQPPDLGGVREALAGISGNAGRAGGIIDRIRDQIKKAPPRREQFDLNAAIDEVIVLGRSSLQKDPDETAQS